MGGGLMYVVLVGENDPSSRDSKWERDGEWELQFSYDRTSANASGDFVSLFEMLLCGFWAK